MDTPYQLALQVSFRKGLTSHFIGFSVKDVYGLKTHNRLDWIAGNSGAA
jgi:hypothetical protein